MKSRYLWVSLLAIGCSAGSGSNNGTPDNGGGMGNNNPGGGSSGVGTGGGSNPGGGASGTGNPNPGGGAGGMGAEIMTQPTWRLTNIEYTNTVRDVFGINLTTPLDPDGAAAGFSAGLVAGDATVGAYHSAAIEAGAQSAAILKLVPCTQAEITANGAQCAAKFIDATGPKAFRRPLDADTRAGLVSLFGAVDAKYGFTVGMQALVEQMLQSPMFTYHLELEEQAKGAGTFAVTGYSMASRLSYLIWGSSPDDTLYQKAAAGQLSTSEQISAEATRLLTDTTRAQAGLRNFYEQWLKVRAMPETKGGAFATKYDSDAVLGSFDAQVDAALWAPTAGLTTLLTGTQAYVNDKTAALFGVSGITGSNYRAVPVDGNQRAGILMHPAIMATFATETGSHPIKRGVFVWDQIVCQALPDPPPDIPNFPGAPANASVRQAFETFTMGASCQACHSRINPVGFLFESYDTIGQYRTSDDNNQPVNSASMIVKAVDIANQPDAIINVQTPNAVQFSKNLATEGALASQCLATQLYRYALHRIDNKADKPTIQGLSSTYTAGQQNISKLISGLAQTAGFMNRLNVE